MKTIYFISGGSIEVPQWVADAIRDKVIEGCGKFQVPSSKFQCYSDELGTKGEVDLIINLEDVSRIV